MIVCHRLAVVSALVGALVSGGAVFCPTAAAQQTDHARVAAALDSVLFEYLDATYGAEKVAPLRTAERPGAFSTRLRSLTGLDVLELGENVMKQADRAAAERLPDSGPALEQVAGAFVLKTSRNTAAARDIELIASTVGSAYERAAAALDIGSQAQASRQLLAGNGRIEVILHSTRRGEAAKSLGPGMGKMVLGATIQGDRAALTARIEVLYLNAFSLAILEHEAAHAAVLLGTFDAAAFAASNAKDGAALKTAFLAAYRKDIPAFILEGIGDWAIYSGGLYRAWGVFAPVGQLVRELRQAGKTLPLAELVAGDVRFRATHHKVYSLQAAAFLGFLFDRYGAGRVRAWLFAGDRDGARSFATVFGKSLADAEAEWLAAPGTLPVPAGILASRARNRPVGSVRQVLPGDHQAKPKYSRQIPTESTRP